MFLIHHEVFSLRIEQHWLHCMFWCNIWWYWVFSYNVFCTLDSVVIYSELWVLICFTLWIQFVTVNWVFFVLCNLLHIRGKMQNSDPRSNLFRSKLYPFWSRYLVAVPIMWLAHVTTRTCTVPNPSLHSHIIQWKKDIISWFLRPFKNSHCL